MIDHRRISENLYLTSLLQSIEQGRGCEAEPWYPKAVELVSKWFFKVEVNYAAQNRSLTISRIFEGLPREELPGKILSAEKDFPEILASAFDELLEEKDGILPEACWVYGKALAATCAQKDFQQEYISSCWNMVSRNELASEAFIAGLAEKIQATESLVIPQGFFSVAEEFGNCPAEYVYSSDKDRFSVALHRWKDEAELEEIWNDHTFQYFPFHDEGLGLFEAVRRVDAVQFTELLETLIIPPAVESLLRNFQIEYDFDHLLELLSSAPSTFDAFEDGCVCWNRKIVAPLLLNSILSHLQGVANALREAPDELKFFQEQEVPGKLIPFAEALVSREDGVFLAINWMCHLIRQADRRFQRDRDMWTPTPAIIEAIAKGLQKNGVGLNDFKKVCPGIIGKELAEFKEMIISGKGDLSGHSLITGTEVFLSALMVATAESEKDTKINTDELVEVFKTLLVRQDYGMMTFSEKVVAGQRFWSPSLLIAQQESPLDLWAKCWGLLAHQRRRCKHHLETDDYSADETSYYLAGVGLCVVDWLISSELENKDVAFQVWETMFEEVFTCVLSLAWTRAVHWRSLLSSLFCRLPKMLGQEACLDMTRKYLDRLGGDDELFVWCALSICLNGIEPKVMIDFMDKTENSGLSSRIKSFLEWEERPNEPRREKPLVDKVKEVFIQAVVGPS